MKLSDWPESLRGYVADCLDWFDLERYDRQAKGWDVLQWRDAILKRHVLRRLPARKFSEESLIRMFCYLNDDVNDDVLWITPIQDKLENYGEVYLPLPMIKSCVTTLTCDAAFQLYEDMEKNMLFENEKKYRYGDTELDELIENRVDELIEKKDESRLIMVQVDKSLFQPLLKDDEWQKPYHEIAVHQSCCETAQQIIEVNLFAPKEKIIDAFMAWLDKAKQDCNRPDPKPRPKTKTLKLETKHFQKWMNWRLLAFIDFAYWRMMRSLPQITISNYQAIVFPEPEKAECLNIKTNEYREEARWLMRPSTRFFLDAVAEISPRNYPAVLNPPRS